MMRLRIHLSSVWCSSRIDRLRSLGVGFLINKMIPKTKKTVLKKMEETGNRDRSLPGAYRCKLCLMSHWSEESAGDDDEDEAPEWSREKEEEEDSSKESIEAA